MWDVIGLIFLIIAFIILFIVVVVARIGSSRLKAQYIKDAYHLLKKSNPSSREITKTIKGLNDYVGSLIKDEEIKELIKRLMDKLEQLEEG